MFEELTGLWPGRPLRILPVLQEGYDAHWGMGWVRPSNLLDRVQVWSLADLRLNQVLSLTNCMNLKWTMYFCFFFCLSFFI